MRLQGFHIIQGNGVLEMHIQLTVEQWDTSVVTKTDKKFKIRMAHSFSPPPLFNFFFLSIFFFKINMVFSTREEMEEQLGSQQTAEQESRAHCVCVCVPLT